MAHYLIAGSTGLIGQALANQLSDPLHTVTLIARRDLQPAHSHHNVLKTNFDPLVLPNAQSDADAVFCALGTTIKKAGSKEAFEAVDYQLVLTVAEAAKASGYQRFIVVSSTGTTPNTKNFYLQTKAKVEAALIHLEFAQLVIMRPSLLLGAREEFRLGERIGEAVSWVLTPLFMGKLKRYRPVHTDNVAKKMLAAAEQSTGGVLIVESENI
jgi:uncharacterized protein YbjT (DUF2867 family)